MAKYLVVVESPAKAKTISKFLGSNYVVRACFGAVRDLPKSQLGVNVEGNFEPKYVALREENARKAMKEIKDKAAKVELVLLASDPDREGEAIAWHVAEILKAYKKTQDIPSKRIIFHEITKTNVKEAVKEPHEIDYDLVDAQQARRVVDRLVGYKISPLLGWVVRKGLSAGRVQSVTVRMVVEREVEIRAFEPEEYWSIEAHLETERDEPFVARLHQNKGESIALGKPGKVGSEAEASAIVDSVREARFKVAGVERKEVRRRPLPPFITSSLQQEASRKLGMTPARTMAIAQQLYQGVDLGKQGTVGLITYMRTDSTRLSKEALDNARKYIRENFEPKTLPEKPNFYRNKKDAQDAHEAIRPSAAHMTPESIREHLSEDQRKLYTLIWQRFVACQMTPAVFDQTTVDVHASESVFRATGSIMKFAGFTQVYQETSDDRLKERTDRSLLPDINEGEEASLQELKPEQHFTKPPPRFTEASLVRAMEENGIGRPSTYAPTLKTIMDRQYVAKEKGRLAPTELGEEVNTWLIKNFPDVLSIDFTARLEENLDDVEEGNLDWHELAARFYGPFEKRLKETEVRMVAELVGDDPRCPICDSPAVLKQSWFGMYMGCTKEECKGTIRINRTPPEPTDDICEKCGSPMVIRTGRYGRFMACSAYPKCENVINLDKDGNKIPPKPPPKKTDEDCPDCKQGKLVIRTSRRGEEFYGCERFPKCRFTRPMELNLPCPVEGCGGELERKPARGRRITGCTKCDFKAFGQLEKEAPCSVCGHAWTTVSKPRSKPKVRRCPSPACEHEEEILEPENAEETAAAE